MHKSIIFGSGIVLLILYLNRKTVETKAKNFISRATYILRHKNDAIKASRGTRLFPSVTMAQAILESNNGNSFLSGKYHNHFGIKSSKSWVGKSVKLPTHEVVNGRVIKVLAPFRYYNSDLESFKDHADFLLNNSNYTKAGVFKAVTPEEQAKALQRARYATDPNYANKVITLIKNYNLKSLDT